MRFMSVKSNRINTINWILPKSQIQSQARIYLICCGILCNFLFANIHLFILALPQIFWLSFSTLFSLFLQHFSSQFLVYFLHFWSISAEFLVVYRKDEVSSINIVGEKLWHLFISKAVHIFWMLIYTKINIS